MTPTDTQWEVIAHLDFSTEIKCVGRTCVNPAGHLVFLTPGPESHPHDVWYPACSEHVIHLSSGHAKCIACNVQIALVAIRDL